MNDIQRKEIRKLREQGHSYKKISKELDINVNAIKSFCRRSGIGVANGIEGKSKTDKTYYCRMCGVFVPQKSGKKRKLFCSDKCRNLWWNSHMDMVNRKAYYECICKKCGKSFISYGNKGRKYCSHKCYIEERFGGI